MSPELALLLRRMGSRHFEHLPAAAARSEVARNVCAFLNSEGGTLLVESGPETAPALANAIASELRAKLHPAALWSVTPLEQAEAGYCLVDVPAGRDRPYTLDGAIYVRRAAVTATAGPEEIRGLVEGGFRETERWERRLIPGAGLERLSRDLILTVAEEARQRRNYPFRSPEDPEAILGDLALCQNGTITNAAEVLFGLSPVRQFPQVRARVTVYATDKGGDFVDHRQFEDHAFDTMRLVFEMLQRHTSIAATFAGGLRRTDLPAYPEEALREGLINAFAHRDYASFSGGLSVEVYPGRLVIWNSGSLPPGLKIGDLAREHPSMPTNPDMAQVFFLHGFMERIGRGTQKILSACKAAGLPSPQWKADATGVTLTFFTGGKKTGSSKLNLRQQKILEQLRPGESIRLPEYCERMTVSERQGRRDLGNLVDAGWLAREGEGPATVFQRTPTECNPAKPGQTRPK